MLNMNTVYDFIEGCLTPIQAKQFLELKDSTIWLETTQICDFVMIMYFYLLLGICHDYSTYPMEENDGFYGIQFYCNKFSVVLYSDYNEKA